MPEIEQTLSERGARYGDFSDHAEHAQKLQDIMRAMPNWPALSPDKKQALTVIADKIARIGTGDPEYADNWHDIQGYAKLAEDRCIDPEAAKQVEMSFYASCHKHDEHWYSEKGFCGKCATEKR